MQFTELSDEEVSRMNFSVSGKRASKNPYGDLLQAVKDGKKVLVKLEEGKKIRHLKWGLSQAAKRSGMKIEMQVLADQSGVVAFAPAEKPAEDAEAREPDPAVPAAGTRPRK